MLARIYNAIGKLFGDDVSVLDEADPIDFESGLFLDCAISWVHTFKKLIIPRQYRNSVGKVKCVSVCEKNKKCKT